MTGHSEIPKSASILDSSRSVARNRCGTTGACRKADADACAADARNLFSSIGRGGGKVEFSVIDFTGSIKLFAAKIKRTTKSQFHGYGLLQSNSCVNLPRGRRGA